jgi:putative aldouronate transport system permease protein
MKIKSRNNNSASGIAFDIFNHLFLGLYGLAALLPFLYILAASFAPESEISSRAFFIFPHKFTTEAYGLIMKSSTLYRSMYVSIFVTLVGTLINLFCTFTFAYPLSKKGLIGRNLILNCVVFTMVFGGGMIPTYLVVKNLGMVNKYWALLVPGAINTSNFIIIKNFFQGLPGELMEAAEIDGCSEIGILWRIVLPLSKPIIATFGLFYAVAHWNDYFSALLYINNPKMWPLQVILRQIVMLSQGALTENLPADYVPPAQAIKMATIVVGVLPIMIVYPFLQKHFAKGALVGAVKG